MNQNREINRKLLNGWSAIIAILSIAYFLEVLKGTMSVPYFLIFLFLTIAPYLISWAYYKQNQDSSQLKNYVVFGYLIMYLFVLFTGKTMMVFTYIFPMLSLLILYHDKQLILRMGFISLLLNLIVIAAEVIQGRITFANCRDAEIQIGLLSLVFFFSYLAADLYDNIKRTSDAYNEELQEKSRQISEMAVQTITTIANTIDAKDEYTEGHSNRVAQYSRMLAKKLGKSDEEADEIYNIALLHDIGKIGVPDSILNKPGKLTEEEFKMIKQHPSIGGKILKDVKSFPNLEVGARYHHERFDGRGYPEGLAGEDIPEIARIICVADSFDAMNSNRVYRRHFTREYIRSELERCQGSQFDPAVAQAMLELMDEEALDEVDQRETLLSIDADNGEHQPKYDGIDRRIHDTPEVKKELEEVSNRIREYMINTEEKDILDVLGEEKTIQKFETEVARKLMSGDGCLVLMDIDNFSRMNHEYGFLAGDACLRMVAETLMGFENSEVCRYEGDSFLIYRSDVVDRKAAEAFAQEIRSALDERFSRSDSLKGLTISMGIALSALHARRFARLLACSEKALSHAKKEGKNRYVIYSEVGDEEKLASQKDLDSLSSLIEEQYSYNGAFDLEYREFGRVYELIRNLGIRNAQTVQLVLFTILFSENADMPISDRTMVMKYLESAINNTVRKVDVTARFSSTQRIVLFTNLPDENVQLVIDRIMKEFYRMIPENQFRLVYVSRNINLSAIRKNQAAKNG
ncbi:MAG: diguanylate cyclase [Solobacterium sp.]|nr:diguanylate cyclase [Solobacterium sp.]